MSTSAEAEKVLTEGALVEPAPVEAPVDGAAVGGGVGGRLGLGLLGESGRGREDGEREDAEGGAEMHEGVLVLN